MLLIGCTVNKCLKRWKTNRDGYKRELKRLKNRKSGNDASAVYTPTWSLYTVLSFLMESVRHNELEV